MNFGTGPTVSVILPVRNEAAFIRRCLEAVLTQDYPHLIEVLVVDGMSNDDTCAIVSEVAQTDRRVRRLDNPARIIPAAMNTGIAAARGDVIVRVDGHTIIAPDYVRQCINALQTTGAHNVGGLMRPVGVTPTGKAIALATRSPFGVPAKFHHSTEPAFVDTVYLGAWPRHVLEEVGGYNPELLVNEDYELNIRIRQTGGRIYLSPNIRSEYYCRQSIPALARQYFKYGVGKVLVVLEHPASTRPRHLVAPAFVAALAIGAALAPVHKLGRGLFGLAAGSYALVNLAVSLRLAARHDLGMFFRLPAVFAALHIAWGTGFWAGVFRKLVRRL
ncbi:MAG: glycosyltransferase family 2 protein [Anaerolineae bacterium]|nr:glycosyltransferase family 2 protein [Anaerolineae bacterium]